MFKPQHIVFAVAVTVFTLLGYSLLSGSRDEPTKSEFVVGYQPTMLYLPIFVAEDQGYFEKHGLDVALRRFGSANEMAQALATERIDATGMSSLTVLWNLEKSAPGRFRIYLLERLTHDNSPDAIAVPENSKIAQLSDLKGKRLGLHPGTTLKLYATRFLEQSLGSDHHVTFAPLAPNIQVQALQSGTIDALFSLEPVPTIAKIEFGAKIVERALLARSIHNPFYAGGGAISTATIKRRPAAVSSFRNAIADALDFINNNEKKSRMVLAKYMSLSPGIVDTMTLIQWTLPNKALLADWESGITALKDTGVIDGNVAFTELLLLR